MGSASQSYAGHYTLAEWERWQDQWELIDGVPYCLSPSPAKKHQKINGRIFSQFDVKLGLCQCEVNISLDWRISQDTVVQPDISVVCGDFSTKFTIVVPTIIFEILSLSTKRKDRTEKFELYQAQKVNYYVMVNPDNKDIELYLLVNGRYQEQKIENTYIFELKDCKVDFDFEAIW
jgi:Uma2 family endonuclease